MTPSRARPRRDPPGVYGVRRQRRRTAAEPAGRGAPRTGPPTGPTLHQPGGALRRSRPGGLDGPGEVGRPIRAGPGSGVQHVRHPDDHRRAQAALPRQGVGHPGPPPDPGALSGRSSGHRDAHPGAGPASDRGGDRRDRRVPARSRCSRPWRRASAIGRRPSMRPTDRRARSPSGWGRSTPASPGPTTGCCWPGPWLISRTGADDHQAPVRRWADPVGDRLPGRTQSDARVPPARGQPGPAQGSLRAGAVSSGG